MSTRKRPRRGYWVPVVGTFINGVRTEGCRFGRSAASKASNALFAPKRVTRRGGRITLQVLLGGDNGQLIGLAEVIKRTSRGTYLSFCSFVVPPWECAE